MKRSSQLILILVLFFFTRCSQPSNEYDQSQEKPNIVLIFTDDQRYNTIHALGDPTVQTPNMDRLVHNGVTFTHAYNMGAWHGAVCVASRTMLNTGLSVWRAKQAEPNLDSLVAQESMWAQQLKKAGYETYMTGKWHVKAETDSIFDHVTHVRPGMPNQTPEGYNRPQSPQDTLWQPWDKQYDGFWKGGKHWSEVLADDAVNYIDSAKQKDDPFFMYLAFNAPHDPRQSPKEYVDKYNVEDIPLPENYMDLYPYKDSIGCGEGLRDEQLAPFPRTPYAVQKNIQEYYAAITHLDEQIGRILDALEASGKLENTYIFFTADHGLAVGHHGLLGKQNMYDHSVRPPLVVNGPGIPADKKLDQQVYLQDIMATSFDLAEVDPQPNVEFNSLMPYITGEKTESVYPAIYGCYMNLQRMVRTDQYKLIVYPKIQKMLLFDLEKDPLEMTDLAELPEYEEIKNTLLEELIRQQKAFEDPLDLADYFPMASL